jgi:Transposase DNA-binding/Transposase Tn5 dimerisation domain
MQTRSNDEWAREELGSVALGDKRRTARLIKLCGRLAELPESSINQACGDGAETKAAYRFFGNDNVDVQAILAAHRAKTAERAGQYRTVLAIQDTSDLIYTSHRQTTGLGKLSLKKGKRVEKIHSHGLVMHSCLAVTTEGLPLGLLEQQIFARAAGPEDPPQHRNVLPIDKKESYRWLASLKNAQSVPGETQLVTVCDREADSYELFQLSAALATPVVVRANYDRPINKRSMYAEKGIVKLWPHLERQPCAGRCAVEVPARRGTKHTTPRAPRVASVEVRFVAFTLNPPKRLSSTLPNLAMSAIYVRETEPPAGEPPLEWMLLTNLPIENFDQAYEKVQWYCLRWRIEMYHKVLKSGFRIEHCRLGEAQRLIRYVTVMSIIAWRVLMLTLIARMHPEAPCTTLLTDQEWKVLYGTVKNTTALPPTPPTLREAVIWIARLGGFLARKHDGQPGVILVWRGWKRLTDLTQGWRLAAGVETCG